MTALSIQVPFPVFQDRDGQPLDNGYVWIGTANLYPITNPVVAYFDSALTIVAAQPLRTLNGYISNAGTPAQVYVDGVSFSILVQDSKGSMVYNFPDGTGISPDACGVTYDPPFTGGVPYPVCEKLEQTVSVKDFGAVGDGVTDDTAAFSNWLTAISGSAGYLPAGTYLTSPFTMPNNTAIFGDGARTTVIKMLSGSNGNLLEGTAGAGVVISGVTLNGNKVGNTSGRCISFITSSAADGPALVMRDVIITEGPLGSGDNSSAFFAGLAWIEMFNIRYIENFGTLWLSTVDSVYDSLYAGNSGVAANVPAVVVGGGSNKFIAAYFGGNGNDTGSTASQVQLLGSSNNSFIGCTNDSANGTAYEFQDFAGVYCTHNQIIGGLITNPSQNIDNTYQHVLFTGNSANNIVVGVRIDNDKVKKGQYGIAESVNPSENLIVGCQFGTFGSLALATSGVSFTRVVDCIGVNRVGPVNLTVSASPFTYTNTTNVDNLVSIAGGTVSTVVKNGFAIYGTTDCSVYLSPGQSVTVTYSVIPLMYADQL